MGDVLAVNDDVLGGTAAPAFALRILGIVHLHNWLIGQIPVVVHFHFVIVGDGGVIGHHVLLGTHA